MLFGSSGIRREIDQTLIDIALRVGSALAHRSHDIIVGMDTRTTSQLLTHAVVSGILGSGGSARVCGIVPTPTVAFNTRFAQAGCMITASHNPEEYNGLKLFNPDGSSFTRVQQDEMEKLLSDVYWTDWRHQGQEYITDALSPHRAAILGRTKIDADIKAVLDCGNGAGCVLSPGILTDAGVNVIPVNTNPSGHFSRPSEPLKENLEYVGQLVRKTGADCAVVHDGDADRLMAFDNKGRYISGDHLFMLFAMYLDAKKVVTTYDASMSIDEIADVRRTPVGDSYVSEALISWGDFGGEPSGAWIFPQLSYCPDGPYAAALFCEIASQDNIAEKIDSLPAYPILRESYIDPRAKEVVSALGAASATDGIRIANDNGWFLIRASGTEPKIRITAEGKTLHSAKEMMADAKGLIKQGKTA